MKRKSGFTLVELLVVIAIIGVLVALLLPAIQAARESSRRISCQNKLKQLGVALLNYHNTHGQFPPNSPWDPAEVDKKERKGSMLVKLLPYLEQQAFFGLIDYSGDVKEQFETNPTLSQTQLDALQCPSDTITSKTFSEVRGLTNYGPSIGAQKTFSVVVSCIADYPGNRFNTGPVVHANTDDLNDTSGLFSRRKYAASIAEIIDGTAHTIAMGEVVPECNFELVVRGWYDSQSWYVATSIPINYNTCRDTSPGNAGVPTINCNSWNNWGTAAGFKSRHQGGAFFVFADGSVHFLSENIEARNYDRLGCRRDEEPVEPY